MTRETIDGASDLGGPKTTLRLTGLALVVLLMSGSGFLFHRFVDDMTDFTSPLTLGFLGLAALPVIAAHVFMKLLGRSWRDYGLRAMALWKVVGLGLVIAVAMHFFVTMVLAPSIYQVAPNPPDVSHIAAIRGDLPKFLFALAVVWITAALFEELIFRGFLLNETAELFGKGIVGWLAAALALAAIFGIGHAYQGLFGVLLTGSLGLLFSLVYLVTGRNLWPLIFAHGLIDTYSLTRIFLA